MIQNNPLFTKDSLKDATSHIGRASWTLIYDGNETFEQETAGQELRQAKWILATIIDHIFDYYPATYFINKDCINEYHNFLEWFLSHPEVGVRNAIKFVENNFDILETITRDELNQHRIPQRDLNKEAHAKKVLIEVQNNLEEIVRLLYGPKKITDPSKPTANEISMLINSIQRIQKNYEKLADSKQDNDFSIQVFQHNKMLGMYMLPLLKAWEIYHYGSHTDFWEEGESMLDYMLFEIKAKEMINALIESLREQSPFASIERNSLITKGLIKVYKHLLSQKLD